MQTQALVALLAASNLTAPSRASLAVDASSLGEGGPFVAERVAASAELVLRDADVLPGASADDPLITVRINALADSEGYRVFYEVTAAGQLVDGTQGSALCRLCTESELSEQIDGAVGDIIARLQSESGASADPVPPPVPVHSPALCPAPAEPWTLGPMAGAGIALTGVGGLGLGLGLGFVFAQPSGADGDGSAPPFAGWGVAAAGLALAGTGVALIFVERARARRSERNASTAGRPGLRF